VPLSPGESHGLPALSFPPLPSGSSGLSLLFGLGPAGDTLPLNATIGGAPTSDREKPGKTLPTTLNQRLDDMGPSYRTIFGRLTHVLAMIEYAASQKPPRMTPAQIETAIDDLESSTALLKEAAKESDKSMKSNNETNNENGEPPNAAESDLLSRIERAQREAKDDAQRLSHLTSQGLRP
jgi:hypothetical protein